MMNSFHEKIVASADVGRPSTLSEKHTISFTFHDFEELPHKVGESKCTPYLPCHNYLWSLRIYPRGRTKSEPGNPFISLYLVCKHPKDEDFSLRAKYCFRIDEIDYDSETTETFNAEDIWGFPENLRRKKALRYLDGGALTVKVDIQTYCAEEQLWTPKPRSLSCELKNLLITGKFADITFAVGDREFPAHRCIISSAAPILLSFAENDMNCAYIPIENVTPSIFQSFLTFVYANEVPPTKEFSRDAKDLLRVANRFGCTKLKMLAECQLCRSITLENVVEMISLADAMCCPLLKETSLKFFVAQPFEVMSTKGWEEAKKVGAPFTLELMEMMFSNRKECIIGNESDVLHNMPVSILRMKLEEKNLDVDGTREMLIRRLKIVEH